MASPTFVYDSKSQRYRFSSGAKNGQFVSRQQMLDLVEARIDQVEDDLETIANLLLNNKISLGTFESEFARAIKIGHTQSYILGRSGIDRMTDADYSRLSTLMRQQFIYLRNFTNEIQAGKLTPAQIKARARSYGASFYVTYENARKESHRVAGYRWEIRRLSPAEHCAGCLRIANQWMPLGMLPPIGSQQCRSNDRCYFEYSREVIRPATDGLLTQKFGWLERVIS